MNFENKIMAYSEIEAEPGVFESSVQQTYYLPEFLIRTIESKPALPAFGMFLERWTGALQV